MVKAVPGIFFYGKNPDSVRSCFTLKVHHQLTNGKLVVWGPVVWIPGIPL